MNNSKKDSTAFKREAWTPRLIPDISNEISIPKSLLDPFKDEMDVIINEITRDFSSNWVRNSKEMTRSFSKGDPNGKIPNIINNITLKMLEMVWVFMDIHLDKPRDGSDDLNDPFTDMTMPEGYSKTYLATLFKLTAVLLGSFSRKVLKLDVIGTVCATFPAFAKQAELQIQKRVMNVLALLMAKTPFLDIFTPININTTFKHLDIKEVLEREDLNDVINQTEDYIKSILLEGADKEFKNVFNVFFNTRKQRSNDGKNDFGINPFYQVKKVSNPSELSHSMKRYYWSYREELPTFLAFFHTIFDFIGQDEPVHKRIMMAYVLVSMGRDIERSADWVEYFKKKKRLSDINKVKAARQRRKEMTQRLKVLEKEFDTAKPFDWGSSSDISEDHATDNEYVSDSQPLVRRKKKKKKKVRKVNELKRIESERKHKRR